MEVRILGAHNTEAKGLNLPSLLVDGILALDAGGLTSSLSISEQQRVKAILLTHHHFDHSRDLVTFGFNGSMFSGQVEVYALSHTLDMVTSCLLDGKMHVDFSVWPSREKPFFQKKALEPFDTQFIEGYQVVAIPVSHAVPSVGYQVVSEDGKSLFYTGDTGPGIHAYWEYISPQLFVTEVSGLNKSEDHLERVGHLCAKTLKGELDQFRKLKGYLPRVIAVHIAPQYEIETGQELDKVAGELGIPIEIGYEGMTITL